jgi:hypothetical protein
MAFEAGQLRHHPEAAMDNTPLQALLGKVRTSRRLTFADLRRLERDILPNGPRTRAEAEALLALAGVLARADEGWPGYLTGALKGFVLSISRPLGGIDHEAAAWLVAALADLPPRTAVALAREVARAVQPVDAALLEFLKPGTKGHPKAPPAQARRQAPDPHLSSWPAQTYAWGSIRVAVQGAGCDAACSSPEPAG